MHPLNIIVISESRRSKTYSLQCPASDMGERTCAFDGCNSLEFRMTGYCLKHKDNQSKMKSKKVQINSIKNNYNKNNGPILIINGFLLLFIGYRLQLERITHWFEGLINGIFQICGFSLMFFGILFLYYGVLLLNSKSKEE